MAGEAKSPSEVVRMGLQKMEPQWRMAWPEHRKIEKFTRCAQTAILNNPDLMKCDRTSLYSALTRCVEDGLLPDGREAAIIPFGNKAVYVPMVAGILMKVRNSGELSSINPHVVYENDKFDFWVDEKGEHLEHHPDLKGTRGKPTHAYAIAILKDGTAAIEVMGFEEIEKVRACSRAKNSPMWKDWWGEGAKKTVIKRLAKRLPMSTDIDTMLGADNQLYDVSPKQEEPPQAPRQSRLDHIIEVKEEEESVIEEPRVPV